MTAGSAFKDAEAKAVRHATGRGYAANRRALTSDVMKDLKFGGNVLAKALLDIESKGLDPKTVAAALIYVSGKEAMKVSSKIKSPDLSWIQSALDSVTSVAWSQVSQGSRFVTKEESSKILNLAKKSVSGLASSISSAAKKTQSGSEWLW